MELSRDRRSVLEHVLDGYQRATPLADGWADDAGLHQLFPLLMGAVFFGRGYAEQALKNGSGGARAVSAAPPGAMSTARKAKELVFRKGIEKEAPSWPRRGQR
ncbi:hypothetical protein [Streptomyces avermitilis]|uniref:hypothetical protein n=1 Tax=Streptomyces avermitilis TaxID=33903 RepID=UPI003F53F949